jgi:hypothetical protein
VCEFESRLGHHPYPENLQDAIRRHLPMSVDDSSTNGPSGPDCVRFSRQYAMMSPQFTRKCDESERIAAKLWLQLKSKQLTVPKMMEINFLYIIQFIASLF